MRFAPEIYKENIPDKMKNAERWILWKIVNRNNGWTDRKEIVKKDGYVVLGTKYIKEWVKYYENGEWAIKEEKSYES